MKEYQQAIIAHLMAIFCVFVLLAIAIVPFSSPVSSALILPGTTAVDNPPAEEEAFQVLLLGADIREQEAGNGRSDILMVVNIEPEQQEIKVASILRDTWVDIPGHGFDRINAAYSYGGIDLALDTINHQFDLDLEDYVILEFGDLERIIDRIGGVDVHLTESEIRFINRDDPDVQIAVEEGTYHLNGTQALVHCRNRWTGDGDFGRTRRQREVLLAMLDSLKEEMGQGNPIPLFLYLMKQVETNLPVNDAIALGLAFAKDHSVAISEETIPFEDTWSFADKGGRSVLAIDLPENVKRLHAFLNE